MLPIPALNEYEMASPTLPARIPEAGLLELVRGDGYDPHIVSDAVLLPGIKTWSLRWTTARTVAGTGHGGCVAPGTVCGPAIMAWTYPT